MKRFWMVMTLTWILVGGVSCIRMKHEMTIQPVHVTVEIRVKIDKELSNFFGELDAKQYDKETESSESDKGGRK